MISNYYLQFIDNSNNSFVEYKVGTSNCYKLVKKKKKIITSNF